MSTIEEAAYMSKLNKLESWLDECLKTIEDDSFCLQDKSADWKCLHVLGKDLVRLDNTKMKSTQLSNLVYLSPFVCFMELLISFYVMCKSNEYHVETFSLNSICNIYQYDFGFSGV